MVGWVHVRVRMGVIAQSSWSLIADFIQCKLYTLCMYVQVVTLGTFSICGAVLMNGVEAKGGNWNRVCSVWYNSCSTEVSITNNLFLSLKGPLTWNDCYLILFFSTRFCTLMSFGSAAAQAVRRSWWGLQMSRLRPCGHGCGKSWEASMVLTVWVFFPMAQPCPRRLRRSTISQWMALHLIPNMSLPLYLAEFSSWWLSIVGSRRKN